jgi:hypothetical protein
VELFLGGNGLCLVMNVSLDLQTPGHKVRYPIPWVYAGFYTMYYWMILTAIL